MTTSSPTSRYTTTEYGKQNIFASEPEMRMVENYPGYWENAEMVNGRLAMLGLVIGTVNYGLFGWIAPGLF